MKRVFKIPVIYECAGIVKIKASNLQEAIDIVAQEKLLPEEPVELLDTHEVDIGAIPYHND
jgi:hypothetical protein